ncbi:transposase [Arenibacter sp. 6A1]|uniref:transposase n=1 Tax=Arenibacter sp. 6A1 TaxID=2720391 RepID=UPI0014464C0E|nr:transposase [Arenibacter sp. 6A1]NKI27897.1 transposase [Arenibacter sp. 6A1]
MGQPMRCIGNITKETKTGFTQQLKKYQAVNCKGCPLRGACHKASGHRTIERNHNLVRIKQKAREFLLSEQGVAHRKRRCWDVEAVFGNIKHNMNFKRFMLSGLAKVETEIGLIAMAHNLKKISLAI